MLNDSELIVTRLVSVTYDTYQPKVIIRKQGSWKSRLKTVDGYTLMRHNGTQFLDRDIMK